MGIVLKGTEIKAIREKNTNLDESFIKINNNEEMFIHNMHITKYKFAHMMDENDERRTRKLLIKKKDILRLKLEVNQQKLAIIPLKMYLNGNYCKLEIALAKGKRNYDKRQSLKEKDIKRQLDKQMKNFR